jgi:hypothetical protein
MSQEQQVIYHEVIPENNKPGGFGEFDQVDFLASFEGRAIELGSIRLEGELEVKYGGNFLNSTTSLDGGPINEKQINLDPLVGAHALCESWTTTLGATGGAGGGSGKVIENLTEYSRYCKMAASGTTGIDDMMNSSHVCELKAPIANMTNAVLQGVVPKRQPSLGDIRHNPDFSIKPLFAMNSGSGAVPSQRTGDIRFTLTLARVVAAFYGTGMNSSQVSYNIKDLKMTFKSMPMDKAESAPVPLKTKLNIKQSIQSNFANVQAKVPGKVMAVSCSFQPQAEENTAKNNNQQLSKVPNLSETQFLWNDSTNQLISYVIKNNQEVILRYIDSFLDTGRNTMSPAKLANNNGFGVGLDLGGIYDLSQSKFSLQLRSEISSSVPFLIYMYFHSFVEV